VDRAAATEPWERSVDSLVELARRLDAEAIARVFRAYVGAAKDSGGSGLSSLFSLSIVTMFDSQAFLDRTVDKQRRLEIDESLRTALSQSLAGGRVPLVGGLIGSWDTRRKAIPFRYAAYAIVARETIPAGVYKMATNAIRIAQSDDSAEEAS